MTYPKSITVTLTWPEVMQAATIAVWRQTANMQKNRKPGYGLDPESDLWGKHIEGCCGEMATAKALGVYWSGALGALRVPDIGDKYQVRTRSRMDYDLLLHKEDPDDAIFILTLGRVPTFTIAGWLYGREAKQEMYWLDYAGGRPAYFVKREKLHGIDTLTEAETRIPELQEP